VGEKSTTPTKLIVVMAFVDDGEGGLRPAFDPREFQSEERAAREARVMAGTGQYAGVIAWSREANPSIGEYGPPDILFSWGDVPEME